MSKFKKYCFIYKIFNNLYNLMMICLPFKLMYKNVQIDNQHKMWLPRYGWSKKQLKDATKRVEEIDKNLKSE